MKYNMRLPEHSGEFVRKCGGWGKYHLYLIREGIATVTGGIVTRLPQNNTKVGRNDPCPCGSGKKSKKCCR
jgi:preprotein translocase subunit SecA|tara:strand:+ start:532 stop:744 length:213 start_codon:yes stop_codon:yes gene_type:complete